MAWGAASVVVSTSNKFSGAVALVAGSFSSTWLDWLVPLLKASEFRIPGWNGVGLSGSIPCQRTSLQSLGYHNLLALVNEQQAQSRHDLKRQVLKE